MRGTGKTVDGVVEALVLPESVQVIGVLLDEVAAANHVPVLVDLRESEAAAQRDAAPGLRRARCPAVDHDRRDCVLACGHFPFLHSAMKRQQKRGF